MSERETIDGVLRVTLKGPLLVGGYGTPAGYLDATAARTPQGNFLLPASTVKGAVREACVRLALARKLKVCDLINPCRDEPRCLVCRIFGGPGPDRPGLKDDAEDALPQAPMGSEGALRVGNAELPAQQQQLAVRPGVGIDRFLGAAASEVLFQRQVLDGPGLSFEAPVQGRVPREAFQLFHDALQLVTGIGNSRSRGLGEVEVEYVALPVKQEPAISAPEQAPQDETAGFLVEALEPLLLGDIPPSGTVHRTLHYLPGSTLRGALGAAVLAGGLSPNDALFQRVFVDPRTCLRFSDAFPRAKQVDVVPLPLPLSSLRCKHAADRPHRQAGVTGTDVLVAAALAAPILDRLGGHWESPTCPHCKRPMGSATGLDPPAELHRRIVTRVGRDVQTGSAMPGMLYAVETLQPDPAVVFAGTVSRLTGEALSLLAKVTELRVGRGRNRGQGRVLLHLGEHLARSPALSDRRRHFAEAAKPLLKLARNYVPDVLPESPGCLLAVLARTDLSLDPAEAPRLLQEKIYGTGKGRRLATWQATSVRSGWEQSGDRTGPRELVPVVKAGSVWLFDCHASGPHECPSDDALARLEADGVGDPGHRVLGLGDILFNPTVLCQGMGS